VLCLIWCCLLLPLKSILAPILRRPPQRSVSIDWPARALCNFVTVLRQAIFAKVGTTITFTLVVLRVGRLSQDPRNLTHSYQIYCKINSPFTSVILWLANAAVAPNPCILDSKIVLQQVVRGVFLGPGKGHLASKTLRCRCES
jgi:hypothetical protein